MKNKNLPTAFIAILVIISLIVGATITGAAIKREWAPGTRAQIQPVTSSGLTKQQVLDMLNNCDSNIVENGQNCNTYCISIYKTCIASEVLEPVTFGHGLEGARANCNTDGYRKMCTCC